MGYGSTDKPRIAIVGGGPAGLSAAFHLTEVEGWQDKYDIAVYQLGWRLGGKGATGRDLEAGKGARIEEHGIHGFCKFYFNTWSTLRKVYDEVGGVPGLPTTTMEEAFLPSSLTLSVELVEDCWTEKRRYHPSSPGRPWDAASPTTTKWQVIRGLLAYLVHRGRTRPDGSGREGAPPPMVMAAADLDDPAFGAADLIPEDAPEEFRAAAEIVQASLKEAYQAFDDGAAPAAATETDDVPDESDKLRAAMEAAAQSLHQKEEQLRRILRKDEEAEDDSKRMPESKLRDVLGELAKVDLFGALLTGLVKAGFWSNDFELDDLDPFDFRDWLRANGASDRTLATGVAYGVPNILFAYEDGDSTRPPTLSTASWLNWTLRSFLGKGDYFYFLASGTGESVILPLYECLRRRGVRFEFFHKLERAETEAANDSLSVDKLVFKRQAKTRDGTPYCPLARLGGDGDGETTLVWPNQPRWETLEHGDENRSAGVDYEGWNEEPPPIGEEERVLHRGAEGEDGFEYVVWAIPPSMIPLVGDDGMQKEWSSTVARLTTTATQAAQVWLTEDTNDLGWARDEWEPATVRFAGATFSNPLNAIVAFDDLIAFERWPKDGPKGLIYLCSQLQDLPGDQSRQDDMIRVRQSTSASLRGLGTFLRGAVPPLEQRADSRSIDFDYLYDSDASHKGEQRLAFQYYRANTRPTEAYVQAPPGSRAGRRYAWECGFENLVVAGDWTYTGFNLGAFESAVTGGRLAAFALVRHGKPEEIIGFDFLHPGAAKDLQGAVDDGTIPMLR